MLAAVDELVCDIRTDPFYQLHLALTTVFSAILVEFMARGVAGAVTFVFGVHADEAAASDVGQECVERFPRAPPACRGLNTSSFLWRSCLKLALANYV